MRLEGEMPEVEIASIMGRIDTLLEEAVLNRVERISIEQIDQSNLKIDLTKATKKALKQVEKTINQIIDNAINSVKDEEIGEVELNIKTKRLQNNIDSLIQKIINEKSKQVTAYGNQLVGEIGIESELLQQLKVSIDDILNNIIAGYTIAASSLSSQMYDDREINAIYTRMVNGFTESFSEIIDTFLGALNVASRGQFSISTKQIHPKLRKAMADSLNMSVRDFVKVFPEIKGDDAQMMFIEKC